MICADGREAALTDNVAEVRQLYISVEEMLRHQQKGEEGRKEGGREGEERREGLAFYVHHSTLSLLFIF